MLPPRSASASRSSSNLAPELAVTDSGNGLSAELDIARWQFINPALTVHLHRMAVGEWICLDAGTTISAGGAGLATSVLSDLDGPGGVGPSLSWWPRAGADRLSVLTASDF